MKKKNLPLLALALAMATLAHAKDPAAKADVNAKDVTDVAPAVAPAAKAVKAGPSSAKGNVNPQAGKEAAKDPYAVPLLKDARPLYGAR